MSVQHRHSIVFVRCVLAAKAHVAPCKMLCNFHLVVERGGTMSTDAETIEEQVETGDSNARNQSSDSITRYDEHKHLQRFDTLFIISRLLLLGRCCFCCCWRPRCLDDITLQFSMIFFSLSFLLLPIHFSLGVSKSDTSFVWIFKHMLRFRHLPFCMSVRYGFDWSIKILSRCEHKHTHRRTRTPIACVVDRRRRLDSILYLFGIQNANMCRKCFVQFGSVVCRNFNVNYIINIHDDKDTLSAIWINLYFLFIRIMMGRLGWCRIAIYTHST